MANLKDVEEEKEEGGHSGAIEKAPAGNSAKGGVNNPYEAEAGSGTKVDPESTESAALNPESARKEKDEENLPRKEENKAGPLMGGKEDQISEDSKPCPQSVDKLVQKTDLQEVKEEKIAQEQKEESSEGKLSKL